MLYQELFGGKAPTTRKNSKAKGNLNERELAAALTEWSGFEFIRTPSSGGRRLANNPMFIGDIVAGDINAPFPFTVETKHYKAIHLKAVEGGALRVNAAVKNFWKQAEEDGRRGNKTPTLWVRQNGDKKRNWTVFFPPYAAEALNLEPHTTFDGIVGVPSAIIFKINYVEFAQVLKDAYLCANPNPKDPKQC